MREPACFVTLGEIKSIAGRLNGFHFIGKKIKKKKKKEIGKGIKHNLMHRTSIIQL